MKTDINGCSTCQPGHENYEYFKGGPRRNVKMVQYDYRHTNGKLFSTVAINLMVARKARDQWLVKNGWKQPEEE